MYLSAVRRLHKTRNYSVKELESRVMDTQLESHCGLHLEWELYNDLLHKSGMHVSWNVKNRIVCLANRMHVSWNVKNRIVCLANLYRGCTFQKSIYTYTYIHIYTHTHIYSVTTVCSIYTYTYIFCYHHVFCLILIVHDTLWLWKHY